MSRVRIAASPELKPHLASEYATTLLALTRFAEALRLWVGPLTGPRTSVHRWSALAQLDAFQEGCGLCYYSRWRDASVAGIVCH